jgi:transcriptional regulator with XRE-family HTH domain
MPTLGEFIKQEKKNRKLSLRKFAEGMGVSHPTVKRVIDGEPPELDFLVRLSDFTSVDIRTLLALAFPRLVHDVPTEVTLLAERIYRLPTEYFTILNGIIQSASFKDKESVNDKPKGNGGKGTK